jgi:hypothetical protein
MSDAQKGKTLSDDTKQKISDAMTGEKHPRYNKSRPEGAGSPSQAIEVTDSELNKTTTYNSISEAAIALNLTSYRIISNYIKNNQKKPYKGRYTFKIDHPSFTCFAGKSKLILDVGTVFSILLRLFTSAIK